MAYRETAQIKARKSATRAKLFDSARELLLSGGFASVQIEPVARRSGVATGTVYSYFDSRAALCRELFVHYTQREVENLRGQFSTSGSAVQRLERGLQSFIDRALIRPTLAYALIAEPVDPIVERERLRYREQYAQFYMQLIREGIAEGTIPDQHVSISAHALVGTIAESLIKPAHAGVAASELPELKTAIVQFCLRAITGANP